MGNDRTALIPNPRPNAFKLSGDTGNAIMLKTLSPFPVPYFP